MVDPAILSSMTLTGPEPVEASTTLIDCSPVICSVLEDRMPTCPPGAGSAERVGTDVGGGTDEGETLGEGLGPGETVGPADGLELGSVEGWTLGDTDGEGDALAAGLGAAAASADHAVRAARASAQSTASAARRPPGCGALLCNLLPPAPSDVEDPQY
jgi:hypothetical protein